MEQIIYTHSDTFHVDELFAITLLSRFWFKKPVDSLTIVRTREKNLLDSVLLKEDFVIDVGRKYQPDMFNFDHHQKDLKETWKDGSPLSSCGMVFHFLKEKEKLNLPDEVFVKLENLAKKIDLCDNGVESWSDYFFFSSFNQNTEGNEKQYAQFRKALVAVENYIDNFIYHAEKEIIVNNVVEVAIKESIENKHPEVVIFEKAVESARFKLISTDALWIANQYDTGDWSLKNIPSSVADHYSSKRNMPESWCGLENDEIKLESGLNLKFCHKQGFVLSLNGTKEDVIKCVEKMLKLKPLER